MATIVHTPQSHRPRCVDVFCRVIDNLGDLGVCWRLAKILVAQGWRVRLWADDTRALVWMAPEQDRAGVQVLDWVSASDPTVLASLAPAECWIEAFGCELPEAFVAHAVRTRSQAPEWINLEYLSAEDWVLRMHGLPSPVMSGPAKGWTKRFVFPGFVQGTGGLLREADLLERQSRFSAHEWWDGLASLGLKVRPGSLKVSLFCYEPPALAAWLNVLVRTDAPLQVDVLITPGRAADAWAAACHQLGLKTLPPHLKAHALPWLSQIEFDHLLWSCDLNFVRGEDSLARAIWAGRPLVWQLYPQDDAAHHHKLAAFADIVRWPKNWAQFHAHWNNVLPNELGSPELSYILSDLLRPESLTAAQKSVEQLRQSLLNMPSLQDQLFIKP
ncbi:MAG: hypothetical protein RL307_470 [Pseudomonadota bacterium]